MGLLTAFPLATLGLATLSASWLASLAVVIRARAQRRAILELAAVYLALGLILLIAAGSLFGHHYAYGDVVENGEPLAADGLWLVWHSGVAVVFGALVWHTRRLSVMALAIGVVPVPIILEGLLRLGWWWPGSHVEGEAATIFGTIGLVALLTTSIGRWYDPREGRGA